MFSKTSLVDKLKIYTVLQNMASGLVQPFASFLGAVIGASGIELGIVSTANTFFSNVSQLLVSKLKSDSKMFLAVSEALLGVAWLCMALFGFVSSTLYVLIYSVIAATSGATSLGWLLVMERASVKSRGKTLAEYGFYGTLGGFVSTLFAGFFVRANYSEMRYFYFSSALIFFFNAYLATSFYQVERKKERAQGSNDQLTRFYISTFIFMLSWSFAWPLFPLAQLYIFRMNESQVAILSITGSVSTLLLQKKIGVLVDKNRTLMMFLGRAGLTVFPLAYAFSTNVYELYLANLFSGFTNSVSNTAYFSYLFDKASDKKAAITMYNVYSGFGALLGGILGGLSYELLYPRLGANTLRVLFKAIALGRFSASIPFFLLLKKKEDTL